MLNFKKEKYILLLILSETKMNFYGFVTLLFHYCNKKKFDKERYIISLISNKVYKVSIQNTQKVITQTDIHAI